MDERSDSAEAPCAPCEVEDQREDIELDDDASALVLACGREGENGIFSTSIAMDMVHEEIRKALAYVEDGAIQRMTKIFISPTNPFCMAATSALGVVALQTAWLSSTYTPLPLPKQDHSHGYVRYAESCANRRSHALGSTSSCGVGMRIARCPDSGAIHIRDLALGGTAAQSGRLRPWDRIIAVNFRFALFLSSAPKPSSFRGRSLHFFNADARETRLSRWTAARWTVSPPPRSVSS
jgi:hypothetical protein